MRTLAFGLALGLCTTAAASPPPIEAYGQLPSVDLIEISPDGSKIAMVVEINHVRRFQIRSTATLKVLHGGSVGDTKVRALIWAGENHVLIATSKTASVIDLRGGKHEFLLIADYNLTTDRDVQLLNGGVFGVGRMLNTAATLPMVRMIDGHPVAFLQAISFSGGETVLALIKTDLDTGGSRLVALGTVATEGWLVDSAGKIAARVDYDDRDSVWKLLTLHDGHLGPSMREVSPIDIPIVQGFGRDPSSVLVQLPEGGGGEYQYREVAVGADQPGEAVAALGGGTPVHDRRTATVVGVRRYSGAGVAYTFFSPDDTKLWGQVTRAFAGAVVTLQSWSDDHRKVALKVEGGGFGAGFFLLDTTTHQADWLADVYREVTADDVLERRLIHYPATDGVSIPAYLTLPPGGVATKLPLVVLVHGGPGARDAVGFDWWSQALASRGYVVLQPEFRGSTGFGEALHTAGYGEWGRKMQTDLSDGVKFLDEAGSIDPARVAIVGGSYGGYAALAGVTLQSGIYRCAVSLAGPSNLRAMLAAAKPEGRSTNELRFWQRFMGVSSPTDALLDTISPLKAAAKVTVPILLIHGADDTVVPFEQSRSMAAALTKAGRLTTVVTLPGEDHWLSRGQTRTAMLQATVDFLAANLPTGPAAPAP